jgi:peptidoglycan/LPS O-acetylase OafA/YrhL
MKTLLNTAFWFVPNLLIALIVLLIFRRFLHDLRLGLVFFLASQFYSANIYGNWIAADHTKAVFGFVFFLWLGAWCATRFSTLEKRLAKIPTTAMIALLALTFSIALAESNLLQAFGSDFPLNTLRISNQVYSVVVVLAIIKFRRPVWPSYVHVREQTFGLYLTHTTVLAFFGIVIKPLLYRLDVAPWWKVLAGSIILVPALYLLTYGGCLYFVRNLLAHPRLRWTVGLPVRKSLDSKVDLPCDSERVIFMANATPHLRQNQTHATR